MHHLVVQAADIATPTLKALAKLTDAKRIEVGLPIMVSVPSNIRLVPGEYVDLHIQYVPK